MLCWIPNDWRRLPSSAPDAAAAVPTTEAGENFMIRTLVLIAGLLFAGTTVWAQGTPTDSDDARYTFNRVDDGYLRLDGRTGQVSHCMRQSVGWACRALPDDRTALEAEIARLQAENVALKKELLARNLPLPGTVKPGEPTPKSEEPPRLKLPTDAESNKMMAFLEKVWRRVMAMIVTLQKNM